MTGVILPLSITRKKKKLYLLSMLPSHPVDFTNSKQLPDEAEPQAARLCSLLMTVFFLKYKPRSPTESEVTEKRSELTGLVLRIAALGKRMEM